jgi:purine catabolism regulator
MGIRALKKATVIAGHKHIKNNVKRVVVMEASNIEDWLKNGDLVLTSFSFINNKDVEICEVLERLSKGRAAGVVIKPNIYLKEVPISVVRKANKVGLPLVSIPEDVMYGDILYPFMELLIDRQERLLRKTLSFNLTVIEEIIRQNSLEAITSVLANYIQRPVAIKKVGDRAEDINYSSPVLNYHEPLLSDRLQTPTGIQRQLINGAKGERIREILLPVGDGELQYGYVSILDNNEYRLDELEEDMFVCKQAANIAAIAFARNLTEEKIKHELRSAFLQELLFCEDINSIVNKYSQQIGFAVGQYAVINAKLLKGKSSQQSLIISDLKKLGDENANVQIEILKQNDNRLIVVYLLKESRNKEAYFEKDLLEYIFKLQAVIYKLYGLEVSIGISKPYCHMNLIKRAYFEAEQALMLGLLLHETPCITHFKDISIYSFLASISSQTGLNQFVDSRLQSLVVYDQKFGTDLLHTLETFYSTNMSLTHTAKRLFVHRKTVQYRLKKINELMETDITESTQRLNLELSLIIMSITKAKHS